MLRLVEQPGPLAVRERGLGEHRDLGPVAEIGERGVEVVGALHEPDRVGRDGEGADRFVVAGVAHVQHGEALARPDAGLVVDLGDQRAHRVHDVAALGPGGVDHLGRRAVRRQHERRAGRHVGDVVDEHHALLAEALDDEPVVHDLVVAVHGRLERAHHPRQRLDRHLDAGAEAARLGEQHGLHGPAGGRSHRIEGSRRARPLEVGGHVPRNLGKCPPLEFLPSRPDPRRTRRESRPATRSSR